MKPLTQEHRKLRTIDRFLSVALRGRGINEKRRWQDVFLIAAMSAFCISNLLIQEREFFEAYLAPTVGVDCLRRRRWARASGRDLPPCQEYNRIHVVSPLLLAFVGGLYFVDKITQTKQDCERSCPVGWLQHEICHCLGGSSSDFVLPTSTVH